jgi:hypothetical protein
MSQTHNIDDSSLINEDLAPIPREKRKWGTWNYAALWTSMEPPKSPNGDFRTLNLKFQNE